MVDLLWAAGRGHPVTLTEEQLTHLKLAAPDYGMTPHQASALLEYVDSLRRRNSELSRQYRIADNLAEQLLAPLESLRGLAADHRAGGITDRQFVDGVHYWLDA